jgi:hypothetical protein
VPAFMNHQHSRCFLKCAFRMFFSSRCALQKICRMLWIVEVCDICRQQLSYIHLSAATYICLEQLLYIHPSAATCTHTYLSAATFIHTSDCSNLYLSGTTCTSVCSNWNKYIQGVSQKSTHFDFWYFSASKTHMMEMKGIFDLPYVS